MSGEVAESPQAARAAIPKYRGMDFTLPILLTASHGGLSGGWVDSTQTTSALDSLEVALQ